MIPIHKCNTGVCDLRNIGIEKASGDYLAIRDADDTIDKEIYEKCMRMVTDVIPDLFFYNYCRVPGGSIIKSVGYEDGRLYDRYFIEKHIIPATIKTDKKEFAYFLNPSEWCKLYRKDIIDKNSIRYVSGRKTWEDGLFNAEFPSKAEKFCYVDERGYYYHTTRGSLTKIPYMEFLDIIIDNYNRYKELFGSQYNLESEDNITYYAETMIDTMKQYFLYTEFEQVQIRMIMKRFLDSSVSIRIFHAKDKKAQRIKELILEIDDEALFDCLKRMTFVSRLKTAVKKYLTD